MTPRIGLIGTGFMGRTHAAAWRELGHPVSVYSRNAERGAAFAAEHGATAVADFAELLEQVDVVDICTPTDTHAELTLAAARAGRHVICEKPLARTPAQAQEMIEVCRTNEVRLFPAHVLRFFPLYVFAREAVQAGRVGQLTKLSFGRVNASPGPGTWFVDAARSGGVLVDLAIHDLDFARWLAGEVVGVAGESDRNGDVVRATATLTHASGVVSEVTGVWDVPGTDLTARFEIVGEDGVLRFDSAKSQSVTDGSGEVLYTDDGSVDPYAAQLREFVDAIAGRVEPRVTPEDGLAALTIALAGTTPSPDGSPIDPRSLRSGA